MASTKTFSQGFSGGEISPEMFGHIADAKYQNGAAKMRNFIAKPQGPAQQRPGFEYVNSTKANGSARLIPFIYAIRQAIVIELGDHYARFHAEGETLQYSTAGVAEWVAPSGDLTVTYTAPAKITWAAHGLSTGDPVRFYVYDDTGNYALPVGLRVGYTYTVQVVDANNFYIKDGSSLVSLAPPPGGTVTYTNYPGAPDTHVNLRVSPNSTGTANSPAVGSLGNVAVPGGNAVLKGTGQVSGFVLYGNYEVSFQYTMDGANWFEFYLMAGPGTEQINVQIPITNLDTLQVRIQASGTALPSGSVSMNATLSDWSVDVPTSSSGGTGANLRGYRYYSAGQLVKHNGNVYYAVNDDGGGTAIPGSDGAVWWDPEPGDLSYEIPTPWAGADIFDLHYAQSNDVITIVHPNYPPYEMKRLSATQWTCTPSVFTPAITPPPSVSVTPIYGENLKVTSLTLANPGVFTTAAAHQLAEGDTVYIYNLIAVIGSTQVDKSGFYVVSSIPEDGSGNVIPNELSVEDLSGNTLDTSTWSSSSGDVRIQFSNPAYSIESDYAVAALSSNNIDQSELSSVVSVQNDLDAVGGANLIKWMSVIGAGRYIVYKKRNGLWGYIGETTDVQFVDDNIAPDMSTTPPIYEDVFSSANNYPAAVGYFDQRKVFGGTNAAPQTFWATRAATEHNMSYSLPVTDEDRIEATIAANQRCEIRHIVPLDQLLLLTDSSEVRVSPVSSDVLSPSSVSAKSQSYIGSNNVQPCVVNTSAVFCAADGGHVRELGYNWQANGYITGDLSLRAAHLFDNLDIVDMTYQKAPVPIVWSVSSAGILLGLTYIPEEEVGAWHWSDTSGIFESCCAIPEGAEYRLYVVIRRTINGSTVRYIERMGTLLLKDRVHAFCVDSGKTFDGTNTTATTIAITREVSPGQGSRYVLTASTPIFKAPLTTDYGDLLVFTLQDGSQPRIKIDTEASTTVAYAAWQSTAPDPDPLADVVTTSWAWARNTISGLSWLEGEKLSVLGDGAEQSAVTVQAGNVKLEYPAVVVTLGLPYIGELHTLPPALQIDGYGMANRKNVSKATLRVFQTGSVFIGPDTDNLDEYKSRRNEPYGSPPELKSEPIQLNLTPSWQQDGVVVIQNKAPLPISVVSLSLQIEVGG